MRATAALGEARKKRLTTHSGWLPYLVITVPRAPTSWVFAAKREPGAPSGKSGAAPATVSGERLSFHVTGADRAGKTDSRSDPRARRPAVTDETSTGGVPRWDACSPACPRRAIASRPRAHSAPTGGVAECLRLLSISTAAAI